MWIPPGLLESVCWKFPVGMLAVARDPSAKQLMWRVVFVYSPGSPQHQVSGTLTEATHKYRVLPRTVWRGDLHRIRCPGSRLYLPYLPQSCLPGAWDERSPKRTRWGGGLWASTF
eukprot:gene17437-biopygen9866